MSEKVKLEIGVQELSKAVPSLRNPGYFNSSGLRYYAHQHGVLYYESQGGTLRNSHPSFFFSKKRLQASIEKHGYTLDVPEVRKTIIDTVED